MGGRSNQKAKTDQTTRIFSLKNIPENLWARIREGSMEAGRCWNLCKEIHLQARRTGEARWPERDDLREETKRKKFLLHSQTVQAIVESFVAAVQTTRQIRASRPQSRMRYPWREKRFYPLCWPAQAVSVESGRVVLPMGRGRKSLVVKAQLPETAGACRIVWNGSHYELHVCVPAENEVNRLSEKTANATVDLGQIHQAAVTTDTDAALVVSGRGIRSLKRLHSKMLAEISRKRSRCKKGSRRHRKLQRARAKITLRAKRRLRDLRHKGTRAVIDFCAAQGVGKLFIGNPDGVRARRCGRRHNQRMSQWEYGKDIDYLRHKSRALGIECFTGQERGTSSRCPECENRQRPSGRNWVCRKCDFAGHRDVVGSVNMHPIAFGRSIRFPKQITYLRPGKLRRSSSPDAGQSCPGESAVQPAVFFDGVQQWTGHASE